MDTTQKTLSTYSRILNDEIMEYVPTLFDSVLAKKILKRGNLTVDEACLLASRKETPEKVLALLAKVPEFQDHYSIKEALVFNSKTPVAVSKSLLNYLHKKDLVKVITLHDSPYGLKQSALEFLKNKISEIPVGEKITMARKAPRDILKILLYEQNEMVFDAVLWNPKLTETDILVMLQKKTGNPVLLSILSKHSKWKNRYRIKMELIRNQETPLEICAGFVNDLLLQDLRILLGFPKLRSETKELVLAALKNKTAK